MENWSLQCINTSTNRLPLDEVRSWLPKPTRTVWRILLLADIHANWHALTAVLQHAQNQYDSIWFLGDAVGYGPRPVECVRFLQEYLSYRGRWLCGNHDAGTVEEFREQVFTSIPSEDALWTWRKHEQDLQKEAMALYEWFKEAVCPQRARPVERRYGNFTQIFVHGNLVDYVESYLFPYDRGALIENLSKLKKWKNAWLLTGHTHMVSLIRFDPTDKKPEWLPLTYGESIPLAEGIYLINPGSVGQPRDGDWRAAYAILDVEHSTVTFHRVPYDVQRVQGEMQRAGYPFRLIERLWTARTPETERFEQIYRRDQNGMYPIAQHGLNCTV